MLNDLFPTQNHPTFYEDQLYVYPVVSRRAKGVSIGINLSPLHRCTFHCIYCQVTCPESTRIPDKKASDVIDIDCLEYELRRTVDIVLDQSLFANPRFAETPDEKKVLRDFAFSGDGEPTLSPFFAQAVNVAVKVRREMNLDLLKLVLITNATCLNDPKLQDAFHFLMNNNGEVWAKLDSGTEEHYRQMNRTTVPFELILSNITDFSKKYSLVIQTMFLNIGGFPPSSQEIDAWISRIDSILSSGGGLKEIQIYTLARPAADNTISALSNDQMDCLAEYIKNKIPTIPVSVYYSH